MAAHTHKASANPLIDYSSVFFEIWGNITDVETFAVGSGIRELPRLRKVYGKGRWRKRKGIADVALPNGTIHEGRNFTGMRLPAVTRMLKQTTSFVWSMSRAMTMSIPPACLRS